MDDHHRKAEALAADAAAALNTGNRERALALYAEAAQFERRAFQATPSDKERTHSVLAVSLVSFLYKGRLYDEAELEIFRALGARTVSEWAEAQLRELLEVVTDERSIRKHLGRQYSGHSVTVALRGGEIGAGTGPLDLVLDKASAFRSFFYRIAEYVGQLPLRVRGAPAKDLVDLLQIRTAEPAVGSYRLEIKLTEPAQATLFEPPAVRPEEVSDTMFSFLGALNTGTVETIENAIPDPGYRKALLELTRNFAPSGKRVNEVALYRTKGAHIETVYLTRGLPEKIREALPKPKPRSGEPQSLQGVLRALHLDEHWLEITLPGDQHERCDTVPDMLDDVVGPMVNHEVVVRGTRRTKQGGVRKLLVEDIELAEPD